MLQKTRASSFWRLFSFLELCRLDTVEQAEMQYKKKEKKETPFGWDSFNNKALYNAYLKRAEKVPYSAEDYQAAKARDPELYKDGQDGLQYGKVPDLPEANIDKMVNELTERCVTHLFCGELHLDVCLGSE